jgi:hypothetical protein
MSTPERPIAEQQAEAKYPRQFYTHQVMRDAYAAAITERAIPAEQALRLAMDYIKATPSEHYLAAYEALRANPLAAKMLEE